MCATYKEVIIEFSAARVVVANKHLFIESRVMAERKNARFLAPFRSVEVTEGGKINQNTNLPQKNAARRCHEASLASIRYINQNAINKSISSR